MVKLKLVVWVVQIYMRFKTYIEVKVRDQFFLIGITQGKNISVVLSETIVVQVMGN